MPSMMAVAMACPLLFYAIPFSIFAPGETRLHPPGRQIDWPRYPGNVKASAKDLALYSMLGGRSAKLSVLHRENDMNRIVLSAGVGIALMVSSPLLAYDTKVIQLPNQTYIHDVAPAPGGQVFWTAQ